MNKPETLKQVVDGLGFKPWPQDHVPEGCVLGPDGKPVCVRNPAQWGRYGPPTSLSGGDNPG